MFIFVHMSIFFMCPCLGVCVYYASLCELVYVCMIFFVLFLFCIYACLFVHGRMSVCVQTQTWMSILTLPVCIVVVHVHICTECHEQKT